MPKLVKSFFNLSALLYLILALSGCAVVPFAGAAAVSGGAAGVNYSLTNVAYKTISYPIGDVEAALRNALKTMGVKTTKREAGKGVVSVTAVTSHLDIYIALEKITPTATNIKVNAKRGPFFKDKAMATEIIVQTMENLGVNK